MAAGFSLPFFKQKPDSFLGIDIGTTAVKVVGLSREGDKMRLKTYGELKNAGRLERLQDPIQTSSLQMLDSDVAQMIRFVMDEAQASTRLATLSIPVFSSFFTLLELPPMPRRELEEAIPLQARQLVPIPISEVVMDWEEVGRLQSISASGGAPKEKILVLVVAIPKDVVEKYERITRLAEIAPQAFEIETFSLVRSLVHGEKYPLAIIDFGGRDTNISIIDEGTIRLTHSIDTSTGEITKVIANALGVSLARAEALKIEHGLLAKGGEAEIARMIRQVLDIIMGEIEKLANVYFRKYGRKVEHFIIAGGGSNLPGLFDALNQRFGDQVTVGDPFYNIAYPPQLKPVIQEIGPSFAVAVGLAMRELI